MPKGRTTCRNAGRPQLPALVFFLATALFAGVASQAAAAKKVAPINAEGGAAIRGYDPVAYFEQQKPVPGSKEFEFTWKGATWRFSNAANRDRFTAAPEKYAPQYGGYCAWAVSQGSTASIDPKAFDVRDGKLFLNYSLGIQKKWLRDAEALILTADANWPNLH